MLTLPIPDDVALLRSTLGVGAQDETTGIIHSSPFTGDFDHVFFSRASLWEGRLTFGAKNPQADRLMRAWVQEARGNVLSIPITSLDVGVDLLPAFPTITGAGRQGNATTLLTLNANADPAWEGRLIHFGERMARVISVTDHRSAVIFPALLPTAFPITINSKGHFLFRVMDASGGTRRNWGVDDITLDVVEALGATQPAIALLPDDAVFWIDRAIRIDWANQPAVVWKTDQTGILDFGGKIVDFQGRLVEWRP